MKPHAATLRNAALAVLATLQISPFENEGSLDSAVGSAAPELTDGADGDLAAAAQEVRRAAVRRSVLGK
eukprot:3153691-Prymnesium_polylepis.1